MNSTASSEPNSIDAISGETTIANGSCSHSPYDSSPTSGFSPISAKLHLQEVNGHPISQLSSVHPTLGVNGTLHSAAPKTAPVSHPIKHQIVEAASQVGLTQRSQPSSYLPSSSSSQSQNQTTSKDASYNPLVVHLHPQHQHHNGQADIMIPESHADPLNASHMLLDVPLTDNLEDMPWL